MSIDVLSWWYFLCTVAVINITAWLFAAMTLKRRQPTLEGEERGYRRLQLVLSAVYVSGCAFRSFIPVYDVPRICLVDTWLSSVLIGRSVATVAELCFAAQLALALRENARTTGSDVAHRISFVIVPLIVIAELFSWWAVLTTSNLGHVFENSLWGASAALIVAGLVTIAPRCAADRRPMLAAWCVAGGAYVSFMFLADVPTYWSRWIADESAGRNYLAIAQGLVDVSACKLVSFSPGVWRSEITWMSLYFSVAVWLSISLVHAPVIGAGGAAAKGNRAPRGHSLLNDRTE